MARITHTIPRNASASSRPDASPTLRDTGIRLIGKQAWGTHVCVFYESAADLLDTVTPYFNAGVQSNESCLWAVSDPIRHAKALRRGIPDLDEHLAQGRFEIIDGAEWYLRNDLNLERVINGWNEKLERALAKGFDGLRASGNALWIQTGHWNAFCEYEHDLDRSLADKQMIMLCTYALRASRAVDVLDVTRAHQRCIARRHGDWEFLETPELRLAREEITRLNSALDVLSTRFPGDRVLTPRERAVLAQIVRGASSKEGARTLGISPRTMEFHRANVMRKLGAKNTADLMRRVLAE